MPRYRMFAALAAAGLVAGALATSVGASPIPSDTRVGTWILVPLTVVSGSGAGEVTLQIDARAKKACYAFDTRNLGGPITGAHIHKSGSSDPVVTFKKALRGDAWDNCVEVSQALADEIINNSANYVVDLHTANSSLRAPLDKPSGTLPR